jgi:hypothetical protein
VTPRAAIIFYLFIGGVVLSAIAQIVNFVGGWPTRNWWRWVGLTFGVVAAVSAGIAVQMGKQDLQWRRVDSAQEGILSKQLSGTHAVGYFYVENRNDPQEAQYYMSIVGVCIKINLVCPLAPQKALVP